MSDTSEPPPLPAPAASLLAKAMRKRRTWVALFLLSYAFLISSSWNVLLSIRTWYNNNSSPSSSSSGGTFACCWPALYASVLYGVVFGVLSMAAAVAIVVPATLVTWITVLVLLAFAGKSQNKLVREGRKVTADIAGIACRILIREGNFVASACALLSFFLLLWRRSSGHSTDEHLL